MLCGRTSRSRPVVDDGNAAWQQSFRHKKSFKLKKAEKNKNEDVFGKGQ